MWIWLDKTGKVKQYLTHGGAPVVGETDFQIFAYFDGLDTDYFDSATIKFRKPDQQGSTYPVLFMRKVEMPYEHMENDGSASLFKEEHSPYTGFLFDFADFTDGDEIVRLLDTPGLWEATITCLGAPNKTNVSGLITFSVGSAAGDSEEQTELSIDQILENLVLSQRILKKSSTFYVKNSDDFIDKAENGKLDVATFTIGSIVFDEKTNKLYKILTVTSNPNDNSYVYATYEKQTEFLKNIKDGTGTGALNQLKDGDGTTFSFDDANGNSKNPNAYAIDKSIKGDIPYGGVGNYATSFGGKSSAQGKRSLAQGTTTIAKGNYSHAEGDNSVALGIESHAEGYATTAAGLGSHTEGNQTQTKTTKYTVPSGSGSGSGQGGTESGGTGDNWNIEEHRGEFSHAEGINTIASGFVSHSEGGGSVADGHVSHAEGESTLASGRGAKSFGYKTTASGDYSVAGGYASEATALDAVAIGDSIHVEGSNSVAFGIGNQVNGKSSFAAGKANIIYQYNNAENGATIGEGLYSYNGTIVLGKYNAQEVDAQNTTRRNVLEIGAGTSITARKNALWVDKNGHVGISETPTNDTDVVNKKHITDNYVPYTGANKGISLFHGESGIEDGACLIISNLDNQNIIIGYTDDGDQLAIETPVLHTAALQLPETSSVNDISCYANLDLTNNSIKNLTTPVDEKDATNKKYVDDNYVPYTGATKDVVLNEHSLTVKKKDELGEDECHSKILGDSISIEDYPNDGGSLIGTITPRDIRFEDNVVGTSFVQNSNGIEFTDTQEDTSFSITYPKDNTGYLGDFLTSKNDRVIPNYSSSGASKPTELNSIKVGSRGVYSVFNRSTLANSQGGWELVGHVASKEYYIDLSEIKPGHSGTTTNAQVYVDIATFEKNGYFGTQYKTVLDVTCRTNPFELKHLDLKALLSNVGSKWFFPRVLVSRGAMMSAAFNHMMQVLYTDRANVGMTIDEVSIFRDMSTALGTLNASGGVLPIGGMNADGFSLFAVMMELDRDNANKNVTVTGSHHRVTLFHPNPVL